jgi:tetratricopeptide (TPR) repeat protein
VKCFRQEQDQVDPEVYESAINYLEQGFKLSERLEDRQSHRCVFSSLGIAYVVIEQPQKAISYLEKAGWQLSFPVIYTFKALI